MGITSPAGWIALGSVAIGIYVSMRFSKQMNRGGNRSIKSRVEEFMLR